MKKGDKVKCVYNFGNGYLTIGKVYDVIAGESEGLSDAEFNIRDDGGDIIYTFIGGCAHAVWEVVND